MKSLQYCRDPGKTEQNSIPASRDYVVTTFRTTTFCTTSSFRQQKNSMNGLVKVFAQCLLEWHGSPHCIEDLQ